MDSDPKRPRKGGLRPIIGWREWVGLPDLGVESIKVKVDTGARTSALHAFGLHVKQGRGGVWLAHFVIHPLQRSARESIRAVLPVHEFRTVRNSGGGSEKRPVVLTTARLLDQEWTIELTLTRRDEMGFRMLLGREAVRRRFYVDPGRSFYAGRSKVATAGSDMPVLKKKKKKKRLEKDLPSS